MLLDEQLVNKWKPILEHSELPKIADPYRKAVTAIVLENMQRALDEEARMAGRPSLLREYTSGSADGPPTNDISGGNISTFDPILISLVRRSLPNLIAYDVAGVQPMTGPTGLIFAMRSRYTSQVGPEAFYNEANTDFTGFSSDFAGNVGPLGANGSLSGSWASDVSNNPVANVANGGSFTTGVGMPTAIAESLGDTTGQNNFPEMAFTIEKVTVTAKSRALKAEYTMELAQDLKAIHGLDAETELGNILSTEVLTEINREVIRTIYFVANPAFQYGTAVQGVFNLDTDSNGRWAVERFEGMIYAMERELNAIAKATRRGKGNIMIVSSDVASALSMTNKLKFLPDLNADLQVDDTGNTFAGMLHNRIKVFIDPYFGGSIAGYDLVCMGYKGTSPYDAGLFYCPYVPLQMVRAIGQDTFQPKIGFKTRYGMVNNPFSGGINQEYGALNTRTNVYYRIGAVTNIM